MSSVYITESTCRRTVTDIYNDDGTSVCVTEENNVYVQQHDPNVNVELAFNVYKAKDDEQLVSGWANVACNADGTVPLDWQDDIIAPEVLEKAAYGFMLDYRESGVMHKGGSVGTVVESIVFTKEKQSVLGIPEGVLPQGWFITVKVHDKDVFEKVKDGTYKMFSIQGRCRRVKQ